MAGALHVCAITTTESTQSLAGAGVALNLWRQALAARGHRIALITCPESPPPGPAVGAAERLRAACAAFTAELVRRWTAERPHLVHVELAGNVGQAALDAAKALRLPVTSMFHHLHLFAAPGSEGKVLGLMAAFHRRCTVTVVEQDGGARLLAALGLAAPTVIGRGVDAVSFHPRWRDAALRASWGAELDQPVLLSVGRLIPSKDPLGFAQACNLARERNPGVRAVVVGEGPEQPALRAALPWATFTGPLTGEALRRAYASADIFVLASPGESWSLVVLEAAASGLAVVGRSGGAIHEVLAPQQACVSPVPRTRPALAEAVAQLAIDPERRATLAARARRAAEAQTWDAVAAAWESVWRGLV